MKKLIAVMLAAIMALALVGCGSSGSKEPPAEEEPTTSVAESSDAEKASGESSNADETSETDGAASAKSTSGENEDDILAGINLSDAEKRQVYNEYNAIVMSEDSPAYDMDATPQEVEDYETAAAQKIADKYGITADDVSLIFAAFVTEELETGGSESSTSSTGEAEPTTEEILSDKLDTVTAWAVVKMQGEAQFPYGFKLHRVTGTLAEEAVDEDTWFLKCKCDVTNEYGATASGVCEAKVTGTSKKPVVSEFNVY